MQCTVLLLIALLLVNSIIYPAQSYYWHTRASLSQSPVSISLTRASHTIVSTIMAAQVNWRTINIDLLDPDSSANFDLTSLTPNVQPISTEDVQTLAGQVKQLLRGGDSEGALRGALENPPYGADDKGKVRCLPNL